MIDRFMFVQIYIKFFDLCAKILYLYKPPYIDNLVKSQLDPLGNYSDQRAGLISAMMARTDEDVAQDRDAKRSQLVAQGIPVGSAAFEKEMKMFDRRLTDAQQQAEINATNQISTMMSDDRATRGQTVSEALLERQTPLNELSALRGGTSVSKKRELTIFGITAHFFAERLYLFTISFFTKLLTAKLIYADLNAFFTSGIFQKGSCFLVMKEECSVNT